MMYKNAHKTLLVIVKCGDSYCPSIVNLINSAMIQSNYLIY